MLATLKRPGGKIEKAEFRDDMWLEIGDILSDGSEVISLKYPDDIDDDMTALDMYQVFHGKSLSNLTVIIDL